MSQPRSRNVAGSSHLIERIVTWKLALLLALVILILLSLIAVQRARAIQTEYRAAVDQVAEIHEVAHRDDIYALSSEDMAWLNDEFALLEERIDEIERLGALPWGLEDQLGGLPWVEPRYDAGIETLELGRMLARSGQTISEIGQEAIAALDETGVRHDPENDGETWMDVIVDREDELFAALDQIDLAMDQRASIDEAYLPQRIVNRLNQIDEVMDRYSEQLELADDFPLAYEALGATEPRRYLVLFQNPAELRPTGGFIGTIAELEMHRGQISKYEFSDVYDLSERYENQTDHRIQAPWAIREYVRSDHLQFQDANWWANFPDSAAMLTEMSRAAGWPGIDGVIALQPETIQELVTVTGPISVSVDGEEREITSENLHEEAERQRRIQREGGEVESDHKEVIELIGEILLDELALGDRDDLIESVFLVFDRLDRRDMQVSHQNADVQAFLEERNWAGLIRPEPETPTIATVFANITGLKTSLAMQPEMRLQLLEDDTPGITEAILTISLQHTGGEQGDPFYEGFQRWWVDVMLPAGSAVAGAMPEPSADPGASNGGAYVVNLPVGEQKEITVRYSMPETDRLLIRRQPGLVPLHVVVEQYTCDDNVEFDVEADTVLLLRDQCPGVEFIDDEQS